LDANVGRFLFVAFVAPSFSIPEIFFAVFFVAVFCASVFFAVARFWLFTVHLPITRACWNERIKKGLGGANKHSLFEATFPKNHGQK
jgi:hypothetical protein